MQKAGPYRNSQASVVNHLDNGPDSFLVEFRGWHACQRPVAEEERAIVALRNLRCLSNCEGSNPDRDIDRRSAIRNRHGGCRMSYFVCRVVSCRVGPLPCCSLFPSRDMEGPDQLGDTLRRQRQGVKLSKITMERRMCGSKGVWGTGWDAVFSEGGSI